MKAIMLIGALYNFVGAASLFTSSPFRLVSSAASRSLHERARGDYVQSKIFIAGVAVTLGSMYVYLYFHSHHAMPFLAFGAFLKYWAFFASLVAWRRAGLSGAAFCQFGLANLIIAIAFTLYLLSSASASWT